MDDWRMFIILNGFEFLIAPQPNSRLRQTGISQMINNIRQKSVKSLSFILIMTRFLDDFSKTIYFIAFSQPMQYSVEPFN